MSTKPTTAKFSWTDEALETAATLYRQAVETNPDTANSTDSLRAIGEQIGNPSAQSIRSKLSSAKIYQKAEFVKPAGGSSAVRKIHVVRAIEKALDMEQDSLLSLEKAKAEDLRELLEKLEAADLVTAEVEADE